MADESNASFDFVVIGGGIVGLAVAHELAQRYADSRLLVLEKEADIARHQSGHNSGVLHSGIYYEPGSIKAATCRQGRAALEQFCREHEIAFERCGKIIVATGPEQLPRLERILERGRANGVDCQRIDAYEIRQLEPHAAGIAGLHVPEAGIVDYPGVCDCLRRLLMLRQHRVATGQRVVHRQRTSEVEIDTARGWRIRARFLIACGGLYSDHLARLAGLTLPAQIVPFRGEYYDLKPEFRHLCRNLIYPVPDSNFPFLGVHFTRMIDGSRECGPNAVLALAREGYRWSTIRFNELRETLAYSGFQRIAQRYWRTGLGEMKRSIFKSAFVSALRQLIPEIRSAQLAPGRSGVRAQAVTPDGRMVDDFLWLAEGCSLFVCNAPSPAATASLAIARQIVDQSDKQLG